MKYLVFESPIGRIFVTENEDKLVEIGIFKGNDKDIAIAETTPLLEKAKVQILEFFDGKRKVFELPLHFVGTDFQKNVWQALTKIPFGQTITYKQLAQQVNSEKAVRAVGNANNKNNFLIVVPCHRVIGSNGKLVGYAEGLEIKQFLLDLERNVLSKKND